MRESIRGTPLTVGRSTRDCPGRESYHSGMRTDYSRKGELVTRDDIIAMVQEAIIDNSNDNPFDFRLTTVDQIERFAGLVAEAEREACAKVCDTLSDQHGWEGCYADECAAAIRERGQDPMPLFDDWPGGWKKESRDDV